MWITLCVTSIVCFNVVVFGLFRICREGGVGEAVMSAVADQRNIVLKQLAVKEVPRSGPPTVLIDMFGLSARHIIAATNEILKL